MQKIGRTDVGFSSVHKYNLVSPVVKLLSMSQSSLSAAKPEGRNGRVIAASVAYQTRLASGWSGVSVKIVYKKGGSKMGKNVIRNEVDRK